MQPSYPSGRIVGSGRTYPPGERASTSTLPAVTGPDPAPSDVVTRSDRVIVEEVGGETVMLDLEGDTFLRLNDAGTMLWDALTQPRPVSELAAVLESAYGIGEPQALADVGAFVADLRGRGLLTLG